MESEDASLWRAVVAAPHDDAPRLIYADWLEEHGQPDRAEFIRVQCRLATLDDDEPARPALERRERQLWVRHKAAWRQPLPGWMRGFPFRRGFPHPQHFYPKRKQFLDVADAALDAVPLWDVGMKLRGPDALAAIDRADCLRRLGGLELDCTGVAPADLATFLAVPALENLRHLRLRGGPVTADHVRAVAGTPALGQLTGLTVSSSTLGRDGAAVLASTPAVGRLEVLELVYCNLGDGGLRGLLTSPYLTRLKELRVPSNALTAAAVRALVECRHLRGLRALDLHHNELDDDGARVLALCPAVDRLTQLDLGWNRIHRPGAESLAQSPFLVRVRDLSLQGNPCVYDQATVTGLRFRFSDRVRLTDR